MNLRGRVAVVTGADSPAGRAVARELAGQGVWLMLIARPGAHVRDVAEELAETHAIRCFPAALDVTDAAAVDRVVMHAEQHVGPVDLLVNTVPGGLTAALQPTMEQRGRGHIINLAPAPAGTATPAVRVTNLEVDASAAGSAVLAAVRAHS